MMVDGCGHGMVWLLWREVPQLLCYVGVFGCHWQGTLLCALSSRSPRSFVWLIGGESLALTMVGADDDGDLARCFLLEGLVVVLRPSPS